MAIPITPHVSILPVSRNSPAVSPKTTPLADGRQQGTLGPEVDPVETVHLRELGTSGNSSMDETRIKALRETIANGKYEVSSERLANNIFKFEEKLWRSSVRADRP